MSPTVNIKNSSQRVLEELKDFLDRYDSGDLKFSNMPFRKGAKISASFGLVLGYRKLNGITKWDTVRIHTGVDRTATSGYQGKVANVVYAPFDFDETSYENYGPENPYGSMVILKNTKYRFELRIAHMHPNKNIDPQALELLHNNAPIPQNTYLGTAGSYGFSYGPHTHTELVSIGESSPVLDELLRLKYGTEAIKPYSHDDILERYSTIKDAFGDVVCGWMTDEEKISHYEVNEDKRRIVGVLNDYKMEFKDWYQGYTKATRYSTEKLFNGL